MNGPTFWHDWHGFEQHINSAIKTSGVNVSECVLLMYNDDFLVFSLTSDLHCTFYCVTLVKIISKLMLLC